MKTSLIIATLNRSSDLRRCLASVASLNKSFDEIIIVEQGDLKATQDLLAQFTTLNIRLYFNAVKSLTVARNFAVKKSIGDILFFVDDDTQLDKNYVQVAHDYFHNNPTVMGISGKVRSAHGKFSIKNTIYRALSLIFLTNSYQKNKILKSGGNGSGLRYKNKLHPLPPQWLPGCHCAYRRRVFADGISFNQRFMRWAFGEDVMFSYQIYLLYGKNSLQYVPTFELLHYKSDDCSISYEGTVKMMIIYRFIFWHKFVYQDKTLNLYCYLYGQIGLMLDIMRTVKFKIKAKTVIKSYLFLYKNWRKIALDKIDYNAFILDENKP